MNNLYSRYLILSLSYNIEVIFSLAYFTINFVTVKNNMYVFLLLILFSE